MRVLFSTARRVLLFAALAAGCGTPPQSTLPAHAAVAETARVETSHGDRGRIRGIVSLRGAAPAQRSERITKDQTVCGAAAPVTRLTLGTDNAIRGAFVYLDGI